MDIEASFHSLSYITERRSIEICWVEAVGDGEEKQLSRCGNQTPILQSSGW
jgi:hypothetical protein